MVGFVWLDNHRNFAATKDFSTGPYETTETDCGQPARPSGRSTRSPGLSLRQQCVRRLADRAGDGNSPTLLLTRRSAPPTSSPTTDASSGHGSVGDASLSGLSLTNRQLAAPLRTTRLTTSTSSVRTTQMRPGRLRRLTRLTRLEHPSASVGSFAEHAGDAPLADGEPVPVEPLATERETASYALVAVDGPATGSGFQIAGRDVVAVVRGAGVGPPILEIADAAGRGDEAAGEVVGGRRIVSESEQEIGRTCSREPQPIALQ